jgi:hypothetical protein
MWALMGKLVPQHTGIITFAYELRCRHVIARWKGLFENYTLCCQNPTPSIVCLCQEKKYIV